MSLSAIRRAVFALALLAVPTVASAQFTIQRTSSPIFYNDTGNNPSLQGMYASYTIQNTSGSSFGDVWVDIANFTGGVVGLAANEDGIVHLGAFAPGQAKTAFFYLKAPSTTGTAQSHDVRVYTSQPPGVPVATQNFSFSSVQSTISANANKVTTVVSGPTPPGLGGIVTITVSGETGTIGGSGILAFTPAAGTTWPASTYEMISCSITLSGSPNAGVITDSLIYVAPSSSSTDYVAVYQFRAASVTGAPTFVTPIGYLASGSNIKHTDTGNFGGFGSINIPQNFLSIVKTASPIHLLSGGPATYTLRVTNAATYAIDLDDFRDLLPAGSTYVPGSSTYDGAAISDPALAGQDARWGGFFTVPAAATKDLVYEATLPNVQGTYVNSALAHIGNIVIDSTAAINDSLPAHAAVRVGPPLADVAIAKGDAPDPVLAGSNLTYRLIVTNAGPDTATAVAVLDTLPVGAAFVSIVTTAGSANETSGIVSAALGDLAPGRADTVTVVVTTTTGGTLLNTAHVSTAAIDANGANDASTATTTVTGGPDLSLGKRGAGGFAVGGTGTYTLTVKNDGTLPAAGAVTVLDTLPAGLTYVTGAGTGWSVGAVGQIVTATFPGPIAVGDSTQFTITVAIDAFAFPAVVNRAVASTGVDADPANDAGTDTSAVAGQPDLQLVKRDVAPPFIVGATQSYTLTLSNIGTGPSAGTITLADVLAPGLTFVQGTGAGWVFSTSADTVFATSAGAIAAGDSAVVTLDVLVAPAAAPAVGNSAFVTNASDPNPANDSSSLLTPVTNAPDLALTKRHAGDFSTAAPGQYTLAITNLGNAATTGTITVVDTLPSGLTYTGATGAGWTFTPLGQIVTATHPGPLAPGDSLVFTLDVAVGGPAVPAVTNSAVVQTTGDAGALNDRALDPTVVVGTPDVQLVKRDGGATFTVGAQGTYTFTVTNVGSTPTSSALAITDLLPPGLSFVSGAGPGWSVAATGDTVSATNPGPLAAGDSLSFTILVQVGAGALPSITNVAIAATSGDTDAANDSSAVTTAVVGTPDLALSKSHAGDFTVGVPAQYTLVVRNTGTAAAGAISVADSLPVGLAFVSGAGAGWSFTPLGPVVTATHPGPLAAGDSLVFTLDVAVGPSGVPALVNTAVASAAGDTSPGNDRAADSTTVIGVPDLQLVKRDGGVPFVVGGAGTYVLTVTNIGLTATSGSIAISDTLPAGLTFVSGTGTGWSASSAGNVVSLTNAASLAPGDSATVTLVVNVDASAAPSVTNAATAATAGDTAPGNDTGQVTTAVNGAPDLLLAKRHVGAFAVGVPAQYTLTVTNVGTLPTSAPIAVLDTLPAGISFFGASGAGWSGGWIGQIVSMTNAGPLAVGDSTVLTLEVTIDALAVPSVINFASVSTAGDVGSGNDRSGDSTGVTGSPDLQLVKRDGGATFTVGGTGSYSFTLTNLGATPTTGVIAVSDALPAGLTFVSGSGTGWTVTGAGNLFGATHPGPLAPGDSLVFTATVQVDAAAAPQVVNSASAMTTGDPDTLNNASAVTTPVLGAPDLVLAKRHAGDFTVGVNGQYVLTVTNIGSLATGGTITVVDSLPVGLTYVTATGAGWSFVSSPPLVTATHAGPIAAGDSLSFTLDVAVDAAGVPAATNTATASTAGDLSGGNDRAADSTVVVPAGGGAPDLQLVKRDVLAPFTVGQFADYVITVTNVGTAGTAGTISVTDLLPLGLTFVSGSGANFNVSAAGPVITATNLGPIAAGDSSEIAIHVFVGGAAAPSVANSAQVAAAGDTNPANDTGAITTAVLGAPDIALTKRHAAGFTVGSPAQYTLAATNVGSDPTAGTVTVLDTLPAGLTFTSGNGAGWSFGASGQIVTATFAGAIAAGDSAVFTIDVAVDATAVPFVTNSATAVAAGDLNPLNDRATDPTPVSPAAGAPDLALFKRHTGAFAVLSNGTYTLTVINTGPDPTSGTITVVDSLPAGLTYVSATGAGWTFTPVGQAVTATHPGPIAAGDSLTFDLTAFVDAAALGGVTNVAVAQTPGDTNPSNDRADDATLVGGAPDLTLSKRHTGSFTVGIPAAYTLVVTNVGNVPTTAAISVRDTLPAGLTFNAIAGAGWTASVSGNVVVATNPGPLAAGDSLVLTLTTNVGIPAAPLVVNRAVAQTAGDTNPGNDGASDAPAQVAFDNALTLTKTAAPEVVEPADFVTYTLVVQNLGSSPAPLVTIADQLPVGLRYASGTATIDGVPAADPAGAPGLALTFAIGTVPAAGSRTLRYRVEVGAQALLGNGINSAVASNDSLNVRSNEAQAKITVVGGVFANEGVIAGKIFADCDCDSNRKQGKEELGIPGVRVYLEDGSSAVTDVEGKYHFDGVSPRLHVVKVDRTTLPAGSTLAVTDTRDGLAPGSRFVDLANGELFRADFVETACTPALVAEVKARRELGEVRAALVTGQPTIPARIVHEENRILDGVRAPGDPAPESEQGVLRSLNYGVPLNAANSSVPDAPLTPGLLASHAPRAPRELAVSVPALPVPADGHTLVPVTVRVPGTSATPVTLEATAGTWQVADLDPSRDGVQTTVAGQTTFLLVAPEKGDAAVVRVTQDRELTGPLASDGPDAPRSVFQREARLAFVPAVRPWLLAGVLEGRYESRSVEDAELAPGQVHDAFRDPYTTLFSDNDDGTTILGARGAVFGRGPLGKGTGVTFRYDSEKTDVQRRFADIRPDEGYPVFGDAAIQGFEAQSLERLYVRLDNKRSYLMYGDILTDEPDPLRELAQYPRAATGVKGHYESAPAAVEVFGLHDRERFIVDELPGLGVSGPYTLTRTDGILYSEQIEVVTRDRNNPSVILERKPLTRFADYTIEAFTGRLLFRRPIAIVDERLNPVSIRVRYEVEGGGDRFWTAGAEAHVRATDALELGANYVKNEVPEGRHDLYGTGATLRLFTHTFLTGEFARIDSSTGTSDNAYRGEVRHASDKLDLRGYGVRTDVGFNNPAAGIPGGREEWGGAARYLLTGKTSASLEGVRSRDLATLGRRKGVSAGIEHRFGPVFRGEVGYRWARESAVPAGGGPAVPTPNETDAARVRLTAQLNRRISLFGELENNLAPGNSKRFELGGDARIVDHVRLYGRHEFVNSFAGPYALNDAQGLNSTVIGIAADDAKDLTAFSEYRVRDAFAGRNAEAAMGLRNRWRVSPGIRLDGSFERVSPSKGAPAGSGITAVTSALEWIGNPLAKGTARLEYRTSNSVEQWLASGALAGKLGRDWTALARSVWGWSPGNARSNERTQIALALRETDVNRWNMLARIEHRFDESSGTGDPLVSGTTFRHEAFIAAANVNLHPATRFTLMGQVAGKWTQDEDGPGALRGQATLLGTRLLYDVSQRMDVALAARTRFDGSTARRNDGFGAELGFLVAKNLRVSGGYNVFGFHEPDIATLNRTDQGPYVGFGFKFDEGLFGGGHATPVAIEVPMPPDTAASAQRGALVEPERTALHPEPARISDPAIAGDLATIDGWRKRVDALPDSAGIYTRAKAAAWLDLARGEYTDNDRGADADSALANAIALWRASGAGGGAVDSAAMRMARDTALPSSVPPVDAELAARARSLREHPGFHCAEVEVARLEVELAWAGNEAKDLGTCQVQPHLENARRWADEAQAKADECLKAVLPPPEPVVSPPVAPLAEIKAALSAIPSGIHFAVNRHDLSPVSRGVIADIARVLAKYPFVKIDLEGHTDSRGSAAYNRALSERRVNAVKAGLVAAGVDSAHISTSFAGKEKLLTAERNARDLALNRRVEFSYFDAEGKPIATERQTEDLQVEAPKPAPAKKPATPKKATAPKTTP